MGYPGPCSRRAWRRRVAALVDNRGAVYGSLGEYAGAAACYEESLAVKRLLGDQGDNALTLMNLGEALQHLGDYERAVVPTDECLALFDALGGEWGAT